MIKSFIISFISSCVMCFSLVNIFQIPYYFIPFCLIGGYLLSSRSFVKFKHASKSKTIKLLLIAFGISMVLTGAFSENLFVKDASINIIPTESKKDSDMKEVWICEAKNGFINYELENHDNNWIEKNGCVVYVGPIITPFTLNVKSNHNTYLQLIQHSYSGGVQISSGNFSSYQDLNSEDNGNIFITIPASYDYNMSFSNILSCSMIFLSLTLLIYILLVDYTILNKLLLYGIIVSVISSIVHLNLIYYVIFTILLLSALYFNEKQKMNNNNFLYFVLIICSTFLLFAKNLFLMDKIDAFNFNVSSISLFICLCLLIEPFINCLLKLLSKIKFTQNVSKEKFNYLFFLIPLVISLIISVAYYPGNMSPDSISQWFQATSGIINDAHPAIMTILLRAIYIIFGNPYYFIIIQILYFSLMVYKIFGYLNNHHFSFYFLLLLSVIVSLIPSVAINNVTLWKDIIYSIGLVLLSFYCFLIISKNYKQLFSCGNLIFFIITFIVVKEFRHNGLVPFILVSGLIIICAIKYKNKELFSLIIVSILLSTIGIDGLYKLYNVNKSNMSGSVYNSIVKNFGATLYYNGKLSNESKQLISSIGDEEYFVKNYKNDNIDYYFYNSETSLKQWFNGVNSFSLTNVVPLYVKNVVNNPGIFIRDRFDSMNLLIDSSFFDNYDYYAKYYDGVYYSYSQDEISSMKNIVDFNGKDYYNKNFLTKIFRKYLEFSESNDIFLLIFWKAGLFFVLYLVLFYYLFVTHKYKNIFIAMPIIGNTLSWFLVLNHPSVRYIYYLNLSFIFILLLCLVNDRKELKDV